MTATPHPNQLQPPHDLTAEEALLGACLASPTALDTAAEHLNPDDFYRPAHAELYAAMLRMRDNGTEVDPVTVARHLGDRLPKLGHNGLTGAAWLADLLHNTPVAANAGYYAEIVADKAIRRRLLAAGQRTQQLAYTDPDSDPADIIERARQTLDEVAQHARTGNTALDAIQLADLALQRYASDEEPALPTGWPELDRMMTGGLRPGTVTIVGARPATGKSVVACNLLLAAALAGHHALMVSLEMTQAELTDRILANLAGVELTRLLRRRLNHHDWDAVHRAANHLRELPLAVCDDPYLSVAQIRAHARDHARNPLGLGLLVIDYLGLIKPAETRNTTRQEQVAAISRGLKLLAKELHVPVVALHQLNRNPEQRTDRRPSLADLRESGAIEQDADNVWLLHRTPDDENRRYEIEIIIAKQRQGQTGSVYLPWLPHYARIGDQPHPHAGVTPTPTGSGRYHPHAKIR